MGAPATAWGLYASRPYFPRTHCAECDKPRDKWDIDSYKKYCSNPCRREYKRKREEERRRIRELKGIKETEIKNIVEKQKGIGGGTKIIKVRGKKDWVLLYDIPKGLWQKIKLQIIIFLCKQGVLFPKKSFVPPKPTGKTNKRTLSYSDITKPKERVVKLKIEGDVSSLKEKNLSGALFPMNDEDDLYEDWQDYVGDEDVE